MRRRPGARWLAALAVLPPLDPAELAAFLGADGAHPPLVATGLAYEEGGRVEVHPFAKDFLLAKLMERPDARDVATRAFELTLEKELYDAAFDIVRTRASTISRTADHQVVCRSHRHGKDRDARASRTQVRCSRDGFEAVAGSDCG